MGGCGGNGEGGEERSGRVAFTESGGGDAVTVVWGVGVVGSKTVEDRGVQ